MNRKRQIDFNLSIKHRNTRYMRTVDDMMRLFYPTEGLEHKRKAAAMIFRSIRENKSIPFIAHLVSDDAPEGLLKRARFELQELGIIAHTGKDWVLSNELSNNLRRTADAIDAHMTLPKESPFRKHLRMKAKLSRKALESMK